MVSLAFPRAVRQVAVHLDEEIKAGSSLLIKSGGRQDGETAVCLENEAGGLLNILTDLFVGILSRQRNCLLMATTPGVNTLVGDLDEQPKHLGDFCLSL